MYKIPTWEEIKDSYRTDSLSEEEIIKASFEVQVAEKLTRLVHDGNIELKILDIDYNIVDEEGGNLEWLVYANEKPLEHDNHMKASIKLEIKIHEENLYEYLKNEEYEFSKDDMMEGIIFTTESHFTDSLFEYSIMPIIMSDMVDENYIEHLNEEWERKLIYPKFRQAIENFIINKGLNKTVDEIVPKYTNNTRGTSIKWVRTTIVEDKIKAQYEVELIGWKEEVLYKEA